MALDMVDYDFYVNSYLGTAIGENEFSPLAAKAAAQLERFKRQYVVESPGRESEGFAICAMAEALHENGKSCISSASVGSVSVHYCPGSQSLQRQLYQKARIYLDIYRGVG